MSAKATLIPAKVETKTVEVEPAKVVLELSLEQAKVLQFVCGRIGGSPDTTPRGQMSAIDSALYEAGVDRASYRTEDETRAIYFTA